MTDGSGRHGAGDEMYREHILDHYKHPRNFGKLADPVHIDHREDNPLCGDDIRIMVRVGDGGKIDAIRFVGRGCAISQASASLLTERVKGQSLDDVKRLHREDVVAMLGIPISPVRLKCAVLSLVVLRDGVDAFEKRRETAE